MTKSEMIGKISQNYPDLTVTQIEMLVNEIFQTIKAELVNGEKPGIRGFGSFRVKHRRARAAHNPKTGVPAIND